MTTSEKYLSIQDYERFQSLILKRIGILFGPRTRGALTRALKTLTDRNGYKDLDTYYRRLSETRTDSQTWDMLINELTVGETYFFRDEEQFEALRGHILPGLIAQHRHDKRLRIWSAGCASGEEPYSLAILLSEILPDPDLWNILILATDINRDVIRKGRKGLFREWSFRRTDPYIRSTYFNQEGDDLFGLIPAIKQMVTFGYLNLSEDGYPSLSTNTNAMDLILFRNVAIYQSETVIKKAAQRFHTCLIPGGWLMVGAAETSIPVYGKYAVRYISGTTVFQKITEPPSRVERPVISRTDTFQSPARVGPPIRPASPPSLHDVIKVSPEIHGKEIGSPAQTKVCTPEEDRDYYEEGLSLITQKRYEEATACFQACIAKEPNAARPRYQMARVQANRGHLEEARSWCCQAIDMDPTLVEAHYALALIHQEEGALEETINRLKKTVYLNPAFALAHFSLANLYFKEGKQSEAQRHQRQAIRLASSLPADAVLPGSDDLTAKEMLTMVKASL